MNLTKILTGTAGIATTQVLQQQTHHNKWEELGDYDPLKFSKAGITEQNKSDSVILGLTNI